MEFPYTCRGQAIVKSVVSEEKDKFLATASLAELGKYIPDINVAKNVDLLGVAFNILVANRFNKNADVSDSASSVAIAKLFINKPVNIEHKRDKVIGVVLNYAFTKFGSNGPLTEEEALASKDPFNVTLGGVIWRIVNPKLAKLIEECSDPTSEYYERVSASWEIGFMDFAIAQVEDNSKNLKDATIITDKKEIESLKGYMKAFKGKGSKGNKRLYRLVRGEVLPLGVGLTGSPAADVLGIATDVTTEEEETPTDTSKETVEESVVEASAVETKAAITPEVNKISEIISQNKENVVIQERKAIAMSAKITKLEDITDDFLKQASASDVTEWVKSQFKIADETYKTEKATLETQIKASKEASDKLTADQVKLEGELKKVSESLASLTKEKEERVKQDAFNARMSALDAEFTLVDAEREVIASDIANLDDANFDSYKKKLNVLLAAKKKVAEKGKTPMQEPDKAVCDEKGKPITTPVEKGKTAKAQLESVASVEGETKSTVESALENATKSQETLAAAATAQEPSLLDKFAKAFGVDQWTSDINLTDKEKK